MAKVDFKQFKQLAQKFEALTNKEMEEFATALIKELADRLLAKAKERTPVNQKIPNDVNYNGGGTLRRGWTIGEVIKIGNIYSVEIINPVNYALYVEKGHRGVYIPELGVTLHVDTHWTEGVFMLKISEEELEKVMPKIVEKKLDKFIKSSLPNF